MRVAFLILLIVFTSTLVTSGQTINQIDSLCFKMCETLLANKGQVDSTRIVEAYRHPAVFIEKVPQEKVDSVMTMIFFRLQKHCAEFSDILNRLNPGKGDWKMGVSRPEITLTKKDCNDFLKTKKYKYREYNGDTVNLVIDKGYWIDTFKDGTFSKLKFSRTGDCEFEIEFLESNNKLRRNYSKKGDRYKYQILDKVDNYYMLSVETPANDRIATFKMYY